MNKLQAIAGLALGGLLVAGCGSKQDQPELDAATPATEPAAAPADMPPAPDTTAPDAMTPTPSTTDPYAPPTTPDEEPPPPSN